MDKKSELGRALAERPSQWLAYREGDCDRCQASCCSLPVETTVSDWTRLGWTEANTTQWSARKLKALARSFIEEGKIEQSQFIENSYWLARNPEDGYCRLLDRKTRRCTVYEKRPEVCRNFPMEGKCPRVSAV